MAPRVVLLGPPASGKGTQGRILAEEATLAYFSTGRQLRHELEAGTKLGEWARPYLEAGRFVPDELALTLALGWLNGIDGGWVLDGFPRTLPQARSLDEHLQPDEGRLRALLLQVPTGELERRVSERRECSACSWTGTRSGGEDPGACPACGEALTQRPDDDLANFRKRHQAYAELTGPVVDYYERSERLRRVSGTGTPGDIFQQVRSALELD